MAGSFISDTLTLNGANDLTGKIASNPNANASIIHKQESSSIDLNQLFNNANQQLLVKNGLNANNVNVKSTLNENYEDERTENDQDAFDYDEEEFEENLLKNDYLKKLTAKMDKQQDSAEDVREQRKEILRELNSDLTTLEQLREQKKLLRSIRLRKEELKALEGRRKALEALKKIACDGEKQLDDAFNMLDSTTSTVQSEKYNSRM